MLVERQGADALAGGPELHGHGCSHFGCAPALDDCIRNGELDEFDIATYESPGELRSWQC